MRHEHIHTPAAASAPTSAVAAPAAEAGDDGAPSSATAGASASAVAAPTVEAGDDGAAAESESSEA